MKSLKQQPTVQFGSGGVTPKEPGAGTCGNRGKEIINSAQRESRMEEVMFKQEVIFKQDLEVANDFAKGRK